MAFDVIMPQMGESVAEGTVPQLRLGSRRWEYQTEGGGGCPTVWMSVRG